MCQCLLPLIKGHILVLRARGSCLLSAHGSVPASLLPPTVHSADPECHHTSQGSSIRAGCPSVLVCLAPTEGLPTHSVSSQGPLVTLSSRNVASFMLHWEVLDQPLWMGWLLSHSLCGSSQDAGSGRRRCATCTWPHSWECPGLGHVLGWREQLFLIFPLLIHRDRLLQLSPAVPCPRGISFIEAAL